MDQAKKIVTIQVLSDIHVEFFPAELDRYLDGLDASGVDILVLAGDIDTGPRLYNTLKAFCAKWPRVVFVCGNHEYYNSSPDEVRSVLGRLLKEVPNLTWLDNKPVVVEGVKFVGGTLWFPKAFGAAEAEASKFTMNDFHVIRGFEPWVYDDHLRCEAILRGKAKDADVVVTHHLPTLQAIAPQYAGNPSNHFFCHDLTDLIEKAQPPIWIFGHTHTPCDFMVGKTRLVCNPKGYPHERGTRYNPRLLLTVEVPL